MDLGVRLGVLAAVGSGGYRSHATQLRLSAVALLAQYVMRARFGAGGLTLRMQLRDSPPFQLAPHAPVASGSQLMTMVFSHGAARHVNASMTRFPATY